MITILRIGLGVLVLGLNLKMIWYVLKVTQASAKKVEAKIKNKSIGVIIAGFLVMIIGGLLYSGVNSFLTANPSEGFLILLAGEQVALLGFARILAVVARGKEENLNVGANIVAGMGAVLILVYGLLVYVCPLVCS